MKITKADLGMSLIILAGSTGIQGVRCAMDHRTAERIKTELREEVRIHNGFPSEMDVNIAEFKEPFFDRTNYWQVTADSIRKEIKKEKAETAKQKNN